MRIKINNIKNQLKVSFDMISGTLQSIHLVHCSKHKNKNKNVDLSIKVLEEKF